MRTIPILFFLLSIFSRPSFSLEQFQYEQAAKSHCPVDTVVWLNLRTGVIHLKGDVWYGRNKIGAYVCRKEIVVPSSGKGRSAMAEWMKVMDDETSTIYASPFSVSRKADRAKILSMINLKKAAKLSDEKQFLSWKIQYEFDCTNKQARTLSASMYSEKMGGGEVTNSFGYESPNWEAIPPGSNGEALWEVACRK